jgi:hypothetical protein
MKQCKHAPSKWVGIVTNQDPRIPQNYSRALCARSTCGREECVAAAIKHVAGETNETARLYTYAEIRQGAS